MTITLKDIDRVYFIGIGGIGMSALARYFHEKGVTVRGYDRVPSALTSQLEASGIPVNYQDDEKLADSRANLVVYTPAIPTTNKLLTYYREYHFLLAKRSDVLQAITRDMFCITVGGTHGKTTISACIAHILRDSGYGCNAFLGGISVNYNTNYWHHEKAVAVIEADEYDRSFHKLSPDIALLTAMDADHLDVYGDEATMQEAYIEYTRQIKPEGVLLHKYGLIRGTELQGDIKLTYSLQNDASDYFGTQILQQKGGYQFNISAPKGMIEGIALHIGGMHNVENAIAASAVAGLLKIEPAKIIKALDTFRGVKRRFEYIIKKDDCVFIDDYAHHPEELRTLIKSAKTLFPGKYCTVIFQPHLYSRTRDLAKQFAQVLDMADEVILLPIYPAREQPIPGVDSNLISQKMENKEVQVLSREETINWVKQRKPELLITAGAGDIDRIVEPIQKILSD